MDPRNFLSLIPEFGGELQDDYYQFKAIFDKTARAADWTDQQKACFLPLRLRRKAADVFDHLDASTKEDWEALEKALESKLVPAHMTTHFRLAFKRRVQGPDESVLDFAQAIQKLARRAYPEFTEEVMEKLKLDAFINGLRFDLKRIVLIVKPDGFEEAVNSALEMEGQNQLVYGPLPGSNAMNANSEDFYSPRVPKYGFTPTTQ